MKSSRNHLFLAASAAQLFTPSILHGQEPSNPPVYHGHLKVDQLNGGNNPLENADPSVAVQILRKAGPGSTTFADRGDFGINFGEANPASKGVLLSSVRQNGRNNGDKGDPNLTVYSTSSSWATADGGTVLSGHSVANLAGTLYADYDGNTGPSFDGGVTGSTFVHTARPVAGYRPVLPTGVTNALGLSYSANVTSLLRDWTGGLANAGLVVQTQRVGTSNGHTTDGWQICTTSHANVSYRPKLTVDYLPPSEGTKVFEFQNSLNGYTSAVDAVVNAPVAGSSAVETTVDGATIETEWVDTDGGAAGATVNQQGLFRFDQIIGEGKITPGSKVARAYLVLTTNSSSNSQSNGPVVVRPMLMPWTTTSLNSSFGPNGISEAGGVVGPAVDSVGSIGAYGEAWFDVTATAQSWVDGNANNGFHVSGVTDGWRIFYSGAPLSAVRPRLLIVTVPAGEEATPVSVTFQNGVNDYTGTTDRAVSSTATENRDGSAINQYFLDGWNGTDSPQQAGLIRFNGITGDGPNAIPAGSTVLRADLTLTSGNSANAQSGGNFGVARLLEDFETQSGSSYSTEWNTDLSYAYFPFSEGWVGGLATNQGLLPSGELVDFLLDSNGNYLLDAQGQQISCNNQPLVTLIGSEGLLIGDESSWDAHFLDYNQSVAPTGNGYYQLFLEGVDATQDGILLVGGGRNEGNYALSKPISSELGSAWEIVCHDNRSNGSGGENDPVAFVYIPKTAVAEGKAKALGRILGDGSAAIGAGSFSVTQISAGRWLLEIEGGSDTKGSLIISPEGRGQRTSLDEFGNEVVQVLYNMDNIVHYEWDAGLGGWIVESRDLPGAGLQNADAAEGFFNFAYFEYPAAPVDTAYQEWVDANELGEEDSDPFLDADGDGLQNFAEHALGTHPKKDDRSAATRVTMSETGGNQQLAIHFKRLVNPNEKYNPIVEYSENLVDWASSETATETTATTESPFYEMVTVTDTQLPPTTRKFARVRLVYTP
jgi:hypothetical protein